MGVGRFICVSLPLILTIVSIVALLFAALSGVVHSDSLELAHVDLSKLSISPPDLEKVVEDFLDDQGINTDDIHIKRDVPHVAARADNVTATDLGLSEIYDFNLWGYCYSSKGKDRKCTSAKFNWVHDSINKTFIDNFGESAGIKIDIPNEITDAMNFFAKMIEIAEIVAIVALIALVGELIIGIFANCSRVVSCFTWLIAGLAAVLVGAAAGVATATATILVGAVEATGHWYGAKASFGGGFLAAIWISCAAAIASGLFWLFTICCCKPEHRRKDRKNRSSDGEKLLPTGSYAPLGNGNEGGYNNYNNNNRSSYTPSFGGNNRRSDLAYEPYTNVGSQQESGVTRQSVDVAYEPYSHHA